MADEFKRFVLSEHEDSAKIGINAIRKGKINNAVGASEWHRGFGGIAGERMEALAGASGQQNG